MKSIAEIFPSENDPIEDGKTTAESLGLQAPSPKVSKYNRTAIFILLGVLSTGFIWAFYMSNIEQEQSKVRQNDSNITTTYTPSIPNGFAYNQITYDDSQKVVIPKLGAPRNGEVGEGIYNNEINAMAVVHRDTLKSSKADQLKLDGINENEDLLKDIQREQLLQDIELKKQAINSDLVLTNFSGGGTGINKFFQSVGNNNENEADLNSSASAIPSFDEYRNQNAQSAKRKFLNQNRNFIDNENAFQEESIQSPFAILATTIIPCTLETAINSDMPGHVKARVRENVYDTMTGKHKLIPQGAVLIGEYNSDVAFGQDRVQIVFTRILFQPTKKYPNGYSVKLDSYQGSDLAGNAGLQDRVNHHAARLFSGAVLTSILSVGASQTGGEREFPKTHKQMMAENIGSELNQMGQSFAHRQMNKAPTITIRNGMPFNVTVRKDIVLSPR